MVSLKRDLQFSFNVFLHKIFLAFHHNCILEENEDDTSQKNYQLWVCVDLVLLVRED